MSPFYFVALHSGRSAVRLAHWFWEPGVGGSNPLAPTNFLIEMGA